MKEFEGLERGKYKAILIDPPWHFQAWAGGRFNGDDKPIYTPSRAPDYATMREQQLAGLPVESLADKDCVMFLWICWPVLKASHFACFRCGGLNIRLADSCWVGVTPDKSEMFRDDIDPHMSLGYWTRSNSEVCLLATTRQAKAARRWRGSKLSLSRDESTAGSLTAFMTGLSVS